MDNKALIGFILTASQASVKDALLRHLAESRNVRKQIAVLLDDWVEETAQTMVYDFFITHGEEITSGLDRKERSALPSAQPFALPKAFNKPRTWRKR